MDLFQFLQKYYYGKAYHIIYHGIMLVGIVVGIIRFPKLSTSSRLFLLLLVLTPVLELTGYYFAIKYRNNSPVSNTIILIEYFFFCLAFYIDSKMRSIIILFATGIAFCIVNLLFQNYYTEQTNNTTMVLSLFQIVIYFLFLILYFKVVDTLSLRQFPLFWIGMGVILFSIVSIVGFGFTTLSEPGGTWYVVARYARNYSNYLLYLLFIPAFLSPQNRLRDFA